MPATASSTDAMCVAPHCAVRSARASARTSCAAPLCAPFAFRFATAASYGPCAAAGSAIDAIVPAMRKMHEAELARAAAHDQRPLDVVEDAQPLGVGRVRLDPVLAGLERQRGKRQREFEAMRV